MLTLHHLNNSRSQRILWLLEELNVDYKLVTYQRDAKTNLAPSELKAIHPLGRAPILTTEQGALAESGAIIEYIIREYAKDGFIPPTDPAMFQQYLFWLHFAEGSLMPPMVAQLVMNKARAKAAPFFIKPIVTKLVDGIMDAYYGPNLQQSLRYVETYLANHSWFAGDHPTAADVQMIFPLESLVATGNADQLPHIKAYVERVHARPAYQNALAKGGTYAYA